MRGAAAVLLIDVLQNANACGAHPVSFLRMSVKPACTRRRLILWTGRALTKLTGRTTLFLDPNAFRNKLAWQDRPAYRPLGR